MSDGNAIDFIEDEFDPVYLNKKEEVAQQQERDVDGEARALLGTRARAYKTVFSAGETDQGSLDIVMMDLAWFCRNFTSTLDVKDGDMADLLMKIKEGRREAFHRIRDLSKLDEDALFLKYHNTNP